MEARGCSGGHCLITPEIKRGDWGQQEFLVITVALPLVIIATVGLLLYCRRRKSHKPVTMEDPDLLARSIGVDTQASPAIELDPLNTSSCNNLNQPEPSKTSVPNELVTFGPSSKQRPMVCSVPPRLPPAAVSSHPGHEPIIKRTWSGEELGQYNQKSCGSGVGERGWKLEILHWYATLACNGTVVDQTNLWVWGTKGCIPSHSAQRTGEDAKSLDPELAVHRVCSVTQPSKPQVTPQDWLMFMS